MRGFLGPWLVLTGLLLAPLPSVASLWPFWLAGHLLWTLAAAVGVGLQLAKREPARARRWGFLHLVGTALHLWAWELGAAEGLGAWSWLPVLSWSWLPWTVSALGPGVPSPRPTPSRTGARAATAASEPRSKRVLN